MPLLFLCLWFLSWLGLLLLLIGLTLHLLLLLLLLLALLHLLLFLLPLWSRLVGLRLILLLRLRVHWRRISWPGCGRAILTLWVGRRIGRSVRLIRWSIVRLCRWNCARPFRLRRLAGLAGAIRGLV